MGNLPWHNLSRKEKLDELGIIEPSEDEFIEDGCPEFGSLIGGRNCPESAICRDAERCEEARAERQRDEEEN